MGDCHLNSKIDIWRPLGHKIGRTLNVFDNFQHLSTVQLPYSLIQPGRKKLFVEVPLAVIGRMQNIIWLELGQCLIEFNLI